MERTEALAEVRDAGLRLLARREHSARELRLKLVQRGFERDLIEEALGELQQQDALSDARFAEEFVRVKCQQGYGPVWIRAALRERGVESALADPFLDEYEGEWDEIAGAQWRKQFGRLPQTVSERSKQYRFLSNRGFTAEQIRRVLESGRQ